MPTHLLTEDFQFEFWLVWLGTAEDSEVFIRVTWRRALRIAGSRRCDSIRLT
jgi:hypothetical protein